MERYKVNNVLFHFICIFTGGGSCDIPRSKYIQFGRLQCSYVWCIPTLQIRSVYEFLIYFSSCCTKGHKSLAKSLLQEWIICDTIRIRLHAVADRSEMLKPDRPQRLQEYRIFFLLCYNQTNDKTRSYELFIPRTRE